MFGSRKPKPRPAPCPDCGKPTNAGGRFCRACGWDADLEESQDAHLAGADLPGEMEDDAYADFLADEGLAPRRRGRALVFRVAAVLLLVAILWSWVLWR